MIKFICLLFLTLAFLSSHLLANDDEETYLICKPDTWFSNPDGSDENTFIKFTKGLFSIDVKLSERKVMSMVDDKNIWEIRTWSLIAYESPENDSFYTEDFKRSKDSKSGKNFKLNRKTLKLSHRSSRIQETSTSIESNCEIVNQSKWRENLNRAIDAANAKSDRIKKQHEDELKL